MAKVYVLKKYVIWLNGPFYTTDSFNPTLPYKLKLKDRKKFYITVLLKF